MIIKCKNPELYKAWIDYYEKTTQMKPYEIRTYAFLNSEIGKPIPWSF